LTRRALAPAIAALLVLAAAGPTEAGRQWCRKDPAFLVAGAEVRVLVAVPEAKQAAVDGPLAVRLWVPYGVHAEVTFTDAGFNGHGELVEVLPAKHLRDGRRGVAIQAEVTVPAADGAVPVAVTILPAGGKAQTVYGRSGLPVLVASSVDPAG
jgi:hypothetical protein